MSHSISTVIIDQNKDSIRTLKVALKSISSIVIEGIASDYTSGYDLIKQKNPAVVILNVSPNEDAAFSVGEKLISTFPDTTLFITAPQPRPELIIRAMNIGARQFLKQPFQDSELVSAFKSYSRQRSHRQLSEQTRGKITSVFGVKGGVGTTTIATNLAVSTAQHTKKEVILVDLNLQLGNAALFLNLKPKYSLLDIAKNIGDIDTELLKKTLPKHTSGVSFLSGPMRIEDADAISESNLTDILSLLQGIYDYIFIDAHNVFSDLTVRALDESDHILLISNPEITTIYNTRRCLSLFEVMGYDKDKLLLILNRYNSYDGIDMNVVQRTIKYPIFKKIPNQDFKTLVRSINDGKPISMSMPRAKISACFLDIAQYFNGKIESENMPGKQKTRLKLFLKQRSEKDET